MLLRRSSGALHSGPPLRAGEGSARLREPTDGLLADGRIVLQRQPVRPQLLHDLRGPRRTGLGTGKKSSNSSTTCAPSAASTQPRQGSQQLVLTACRCPTIAAEGRSSWTYHSTPAPNTFYLIDVM